jgi:predicted CoA-binding protein
MAQGVAIIGASADRAKFGNKSVRAHADRGWRVYPVNPRAVEIEGWPAYAKLADIPGPVDRVSLYVPPEVGLALLDQIAALRPQEVYVNPGAESVELLARARSLGLNVVVACSMLAIGAPPEQYDD